MEVGEAKRSGEVTSITYSPRFDCNVGLGYVPAEASDVGTQVVIHGPDEIVTVKLRTTTGAPAADVPRCPQGMLCTILVSRKSSRPIAPPSRPLPEAL
ncbi:MAG: hypothetical protein CM15mP84_05110 [Cellvibrionales bacterium]|nr:MAG: hypothetical protein CM15mP84_05110 [Cellvibrionales bacterium]